MTELDVKTHFADMRRSQKRFYAAILLLFIIILGFEIYRVMYLDARTMSLVRRLNACQIHKGVIMPMDDTTPYPANVAEEPDHAD